MTVTEGLGIGGWHDQCLALSYRTFFFFFLRKCMEKSEEDPKVMRAKLGCWQKTLNTIEPLTFCTILWRVIAVIGSL